jgi:G protein beta subunit-like protein
MNPVQWTMENSFTAHNEYLLKCVISPDMATLATTSADHSIKLWQLKQGMSSSGGSRTEDGSAPMSTGSDKGGEQGVPLVKCLAHHQRWVWDAVFSADSSYMVSASSDQSAKLWDLRSGDVIRNYLGHNLAVTCVALNDSNIE